jgi:hypothetical protein
MRGKLMAASLIAVRSIDNGVMKLFKYETVGSQIAFLDRAVIKAVERFAEEVVRLALQCVQFFEGVYFSNQRNRGQELFTVQRTHPSFVALDKMLDRGAARPQHGKKQNRDQDVVAVFFHECSFVAVNASRGSPGAQAARHPCRCLVSQSWLRSAFLSRAKAERRIAPG